MRRPGEVGTCTLDTFRAQWLVSVVGKATAGFGFVRTLSDKFPKES